MIRERISHGDLKGHNLFWEHDRWSLIDLDAMQQHGSDASFARAYAKDRARFLRNWPTDSALYRLLDQPAHSGARHQHRRLRGNTRGIDDSRPSGALSHDPSAALYIDGKLIAAVEEERFVRDKHAKNRMPYESAKFCLEQAGIKPCDVDVVAIPFAPISIFEKARWHYAKRYWYAPDRALDAILMGNRRYYRYKKRIEWCLQQLGFDLKKVKIQPVEHHLAHASSAYHCSGFTEKTAILGIDGKGEYATTFFGWGENGKIHKIKEFYDPDSLGGLYGAITEYLGFEMPRWRVQGHGHGAVR